MSRKRSMIVHLMWALGSSAAIAYLVVSLFLHFSWADLTVSYTGFNRWGPSQLTGVEGPVIVLLFLAIITWQGFFEDRRALRAEQDKSGDSDRTPSAEDHDK